MAEDIDDEPEDDGMGRTMATVALVQGFKLMGLNYQAFHEEHEDEAETLLDFAVLNGSHVDDRAAAAAADDDDGPTDEELDAIPDAKRVA